MKKISFIATIPVWIGYLAFATGWYILYEDDKHISAMNDIVGWFFE